MLRLIVTDLVASTRIWLGALVVIVAAAFVATVAVSFIATGLASGGQAREALSSLGGVVIGFSAIAAIVVLTSVANLTIALQQRSYALWQLVGLRPALVGWVVLGQLSIVSVLGASIGCLIALPLLPAVFHALFSSWAEVWRLVSGTPAQVNDVALILVIAGTAVVVLLGGLRGALRASRVPPIEALREPDPPRVRAGWLRWAVAVVTGGLVTAMALGLRGASFSTISSQAVMLIPFLSAPLAALGPLLFPLVLRAWTALLPRRVSPSWFLARHSARYRLSQSSAAIAPLMVAITLAGGLYTAMQLLTAAGEARGITGDFTIPVQAAVVVLGGPLLLSGLGAAATVFMAGRAREREFALIQSAGGTTATIVVMAVWEAVIYATTAVIFAGVAILTGGAFLAGVLEVPLTVAVMPCLVVTAGGFLLLLASTVIPTLVAVHRDIPRTLAVE